MSTRFIIVLIAKIDVVGVAELHLGEFGAQLKGGLDSGRRAGLAMAAGERPPDRLCVPGAGNDTVAIRKVWSQAEMPDFQQRVFVRLADGKLAQEFRVMGAGVSGGSALVFLASLGEKLSRKQLAADVFGGGLWIAQPVTGQPLQLSGAREGARFCVARLGRRFLRGVGRARPGPGAGCGWRPRILRPDAGPFAVGGLGGNSPPSTSEIAETGL
jgi:hypothetical protein